MSSHFSGYSTPSPSNIRAGVEARYGTPIRYHAFSNGVRMECARIVHNYEGTAKATNEYTADSAVVASVAIEASKIPPDQLPAGSNPFTFAIIDSYEARQAYESCKQ